MSRIAVIGLGKIGSLVAEMCLDRSDFELAAGVVATAAKDGLDVGEILGREPIGLKTTRDIEAVARDPSVDAVIYCGLGLPGTVAAVFARFAGNGKDCVTVTGMVHPETALGSAGARALADRAVEGGGRIVGTGWNPGFLLDLMPVTWGSSVPDIDHVFAERICDLGGWGGGVLDLLGIGAREAVPGVRWMSHLPVEECVRIVSDALSLGVERVEPVFERRTAQAPREVAGRRVEAGATVGFRAMGAGMVGDDEVVRLGWNAVFGLDPELDEMDDSVRLRIDGRTSLEVIATGTTFSDAYPATAARALNIVHPLGGMPPGLFRPDQVPASAAPVKFDAKP